MNKTDCAPQQDVSLTDEGKTAALPVAPRWYCVSRDGMATLCTCEADAKVEALTYAESYEMAVARLVLAMDYMHPEQKRAFNAAWAEKRAELWALGLMA